nr:uncharacterized protein LOC109155623 isoform X3 [Ipomoea batatas]
MKSLDNWWITGMEGVLDLRITDALLRLARWLVTNFNPTDLTLELHSGIGIRITREDVSLLPHKDIRVEAPIGHQHSVNEYDYRTPSPIHKDTDPTSGYAECTGRSHTICGTAKNVTLRSEMALLEDVNVFLNSLEILEICITID